MISTIKAVLHNGAHVCAAVLVGYLLSFNMANAQKTEDITAMANSVDTSFAYLTPLEYAFMMHEETKFMLRVPAVGVGVEWEMLPYISLMAQYALSTRYNFYRIETEFVHDLSAEMRWYYGNRKREVRDLSGAYIALGIQKGNDEIYLYSNGPESFGDFGFKYFAKWGFQRRVLGSGLVDVGVRLGMHEWRSRRQTNYQTWYFESVATVGLGLVFGDEKPLDYEKLCPVLKCYDAERFLLKFDVANLIQMMELDALQGSSAAVFLSPRVGAEFKLFNSSFSLDLNTMLNVGITRFQNQRENVELSVDESFLWHAETRWYYNLKRRIKLGKTGNGLSANYVAAGFKDVFYQLDGIQWRDAGSPDPHIAAGVQRTLGKHFYSDIKMGYMHDLRHPNNRRFGFFTDFQVGLKF